MAKRPIADLRELRLSEKTGTYQVDAHANVLFPGLDGYVVLVEGTRREVNRAGRIAVAHEEHEKLRLRTARDRATRLQDLLAHIDVEATHIFSCSDDAIDAADIAEGFVNTTTSLVAPLVTAIEDIKSLQASAVRGFAIRKAPPANSDPLARYFIATLAESYFRFRGEEPPKGRSGTFVDFLEAAWIDLGFPQLHGGSGHSLQERAKGLQGSTSKTP